ncbi:MAG TPA: extracellular solute-binding protein, partial [Roseiflexaceae bacterium]
RSPHQSQWEATFAGTTVPARKSVAERSRYWQKADPQIGAALKAALDSPAARRMSGLTPPPIFDSFGFDEVLVQVMHGEKTARAALAEAQRAREQRLAQQPPTSPTPAPLVVATPIPEAAPSATTITFGAPSFAVDQAGRLAASFNAANPDIFVAVKDISPGVAGQINSDTRIRPLAQVAATTDCFSFFGPLDPVAITATLDLQPLIDADPGFPSDDYPAALLAPFRQGTALHALPDAVYFRVLHYNRAAFDAAALAQPTAAWTLDDFMAAAQRLTSGAGKDRQYGFGSFGGQTREVFFFLDRLGAAETTGSGAAQQPNFADPRVVQAVRVYLDLLRAASPHTHLQGYRRDDLRDEAYGLITAGRVAMWFDLGLGLPGDMNAQSSFAHAIAPPPLGSSPITANDFFVRGLAVSAQSPQREACWAWLKYVSGGMSSLRGGFPARRSLAESDAFISQAPPGAAAIYEAYRAAFERTLSAGGALANRDQSPVDYYWFFRALDRALQGANLERELAQAQDLTRQFLICVQGGTPGGTCATRVDPDYQGRKNAAPETS